MKVGSYAEWVKATKLYGGDREEWEKLQTRKTWDETIDEVLAIIKKK